MNTTQLITNLKRECWEFKSHVLWIPIVALAVVIIGLLGLMYNADAFHFEDILRGLQRFTKAPHVNAYGNITLVISVFIFLPFLTIAAFVQLHYFVSSMFDERRDLSIYFWRSLPVSDLQAVLVKLITGAIIIPGCFMLATMVLIVLFIVLSFIVTIISSIGFDTSLWALWHPSKLLTGLIVVWASLLPMSIWFFPVYSWLLLASSFANRAPFLWAVLPFVIIVVLEVMIAEALGRHDLFFVDMLERYLNIQPQFEVFANHYEKNFENGSINIWHIWQIFWSKISIWGTLLGAGFLYLAYWLRTHRR